MSMKPFLIGAVAAAVFAALPADGSRVHAQVQVVPPSGAPDGPPGRPSADATFEDGHYRHTLSGIELDFPAGWNYEGTTAWSANPGETARWSRAQLGGSSQGTASINVWMTNATPGVAPETQASRDALIAGKARQRTAYPNWAVRAESVKSVVIGGLPAVVAVADWRQRSGKPRIEYLLWLYGSRSWALFFSFASPDQLEALQLDVDRVARSAKMP
jgi:hypothetical protein